MSTTTTASRLVTVTWHVLGQTAYRISKVRLTEGYSTEHDIPAILSIRHLTGGREAADLVVVDSIAPDSIGG